MAAVPVTITGVLADKYGRTLQAVTLMGELVRSDVGVGGGPVYPPSGGAPPDLGIWPNPPEGIAPHPEHPIVIPKPPVDVPPPSVWPPGPGIDWPEHPIVLPPPIDGTTPPIPPGTLIDWKPVWTPDRGWFIVGVPNVPHPAPSKKK